MTAGADAERLRARRYIRQLLEACREQPTPSRVAALRDHALWAEADDACASLGDPPGLRGALADVRRRLEGDVSSLPDAWERRFRGRGAAGTSCAFYFAVERAAVSLGEEAAPAVSPAPDAALAPRIVIWEVTQACDLACVHCRAEARPSRDPGELSTDEGKRLLEEIARFGRPLLVLTGGDPLKRPDLADLVRHAAGTLSLRVALAPSVTPLLTAAAMEALRNAGLSRLALSLDGADAETHDAFRGSPGSFDATLARLREARALGIEVQANTTVARHDAAALRGIASLLSVLDISLWSVFFLVPVGRARRDQMLSAEEHEAALRILCDIASEVRYAIKTTEAPHFRRVARQRAAAGWAPPVALPARGVNDGDGIVFVSHGGAIWPSGFLPLGAGNVRDDSLVEVYRESPVFRSLRDRSRLKGKCGACEFRELCGGSRARAYALSGDPFGPDPACAYVPGGPGAATAAAAPWPGICPSHLDGG